MNRIIRIGSEASAAVFGSLSCDELRHKALLGAAKASGTSVQRPHETPIDAAGLRKCLGERFAAIDFEQAKEDVAPFLKDSRELSLWGSGFFMELIPQIETSEG